MKMPTESEQRKSQFLSKHFKFTKVSAEEYLNKVKSVLVKTLPGDSITFRLYHLDPRNHSSSMNFSIFYNDIRDSVMLRDERGVTYDHNEAVELLSRSYKEIPKQELEERKEKLRALLKSK